MNRLMSVVKKKNFAAGSKLMNDTCIYKSINKVEHTSLLNFIIITPMMRYNNEMMVLLYKQRR